MIPEFVRGSIAPAFTAFDADGRIDEDGQRQLLDFLLERGGISAFFVRSGMGRMYTFNYEEVQLMARLACGHLAGEGPVLVGTTGIWDRDPDRRPDPAVYTRQAVELSQFAERAGAAGVVSTLPDAILPAGKDTAGDVTLRYFEAVSQAVTCPVFIYQPPGTPKEYRVTVEVARKLADMPNMAAMKASTTDAAFILNTCWATRDKDFAYIVGAETAFFAGLACGARAVIGQGAVVNPQILNAVQCRFEQGDMQGAMDAQRSANLLVEECQSCQEFFMLYAADKGYQVQPYQRRAHKGAYKDEAKEPYTQETYECYKRLLESELAKYL